jgi:hypothetical protein
VLDTWFFVLGLDQDSGFFYSLQTSSVHRRGDAVGRILMCDTLLMRIFSVA